MHPFHLRHILNLKTLIIVGTVSLLITFVLLMFSDDLHHQGKVTLRKQVKSNYNPSLENDKKMFHWMNEEETKNKTEGNVSKKLYESSNLLFQKDTRPPLSVPRIVKYCNPPYSQEMGSEGLVTEDYKLLNVHVLIRHGDRSPITRLPGVSMEELNCLMDTSQHSHIPKVTNFVNVMAATTQKLPKSSKFNRWPLYPAHARCSDGQLTGRGSLQHILYGMHYHERYYLKHRLFDENNWHSKIIVHTTEVPRTFQSAIAFLYGLLPSFDFEKINLKGSNNINFCQDSVFGSSCNCLGIEALQAKATKECRTEKSYLDMMTRFKYVLNYVETVLNVQQNEIPFASALIDGLSSYACHNTAPPCNSQGMCITAKTIEYIWEKVDHRSNCIHKNENYKAWAKAHIHGLLYRIAQEMHEVINSKTGETFHLYSGHDTTVSPLITSLELEDAVWPGYASRIVFELYHRLSTQKHLIRILQNGKVVTNETIFCRNKTENGFCIFEEFYNHVTSHNLQKYCNSLQFLSS